MTAAMHRNRIRQPITSESGPTISRSSQYNRAAAFGGINAVVIGAIADCSALANRNDLESSPRS